MKSTSLRRRRYFNHIKMKAMKNEMPTQQVMNKMETILYLLFLNVAETAQSQVKATLHPRGAPLESQINMQAINPSLKKPMIIFTGKYLRNLPAQCDSSTSLRDYIQSKVKLVSYSTSSLVCDKLIIINNNLLSYSYKA